MLGLYLLAELASSRCNPKKKWGICTSKKIAGLGSHIAYIGYVPRAHQINVLPAIHCIHYIQLSNIRYTYK